MISLNTDSGVVADTLNKRNICNYKSKAIFAIIKLSFLSESLLNGSYV